MDNKKTYTILSHQFIFFCKYGYLPKCIDHINNDKSDNRINNLRDISLSENQWNRKGKGYYWNKKTNKFHSNIKIDNKIKYIGYFNTEEEAKKAYLNAKKTYHSINGE